MHLELFLSRRSPLIYCCQERLFVCSQLLVANMGHNEVWNSHQGAGKGSRGW